jgi:hypothetical protein
MKIDRTTKVLLLLIALGLWFNTLASVVRPIVIKADTDSTLQDIAHDVHNLSVCVSGFHVRVHNEN